MYFVVFFLLRRRPPISTRTATLFPSTTLCRSRGVVVVPERNQLAQAQGAGERGGLVRDALHHAAVAHEHPGAVVDHGEFGAVEALREQLLGQREAQDRKSTRLNSSH